MSKLLATLLALVFGSAVSAQGPDGRVNGDIAALFKAGKFAEAEAALTKTGSADPYTIAWLRLKQGKHNEAIALLKQEVSKPMTTATTRSEAIVKSLGVLSDLSPDHAIEFGELYSNDLTPEIANAPVLLCMSALYLKKKDVAHAEVYVNRVLTANYRGTDLKAALLTLIVYYYENSNSSAGLVYFDRLMDKVPEVRLEPSEQLLWARLASAAGRPLDAIKKIDAIESMYPDYHKTHRHMLHLTKAAAYEAYGDAAEARLQYNAVLAMSIDNPTLQSAGALATMKLKQYDQEDATRATMNKLASEASRSGVQTTGKSTYLGVRRTPVLGVLIFTTVVCVIIYIVRTRQYHV